MPASFQTAPSWPGPSMNRQPSLGLHTISSRSQSVRSQSRRTMSRSATLPGWVELKMFHALIMIAVKPSTSQLWIRSS